MTTLKPGDIVEVNFSRGAQPTDTYGLYALPGPVTDDGKVQWVWAGEVGIVVACNEFIDHTSVKEREVFVVFSNASGWNLEVGFKPVT